jgi:hypothetical protein
MREGTTMTEELEEQGAAVSQKLRLAAENTLIKAKEAIDQYMKRADRFYKSTDAAAQASQAGARELGAKAMGFAEANIGSMFEFAQKLVHAQDARDVLVLQQEFIKTQVETLNSQIRELGATAVQAPATPKRRQGDEEAREQQEHEQRERPNQDQEKQERSEP